MEEGIQGSFKAIESFAVRSRKEFYIIGEIIEGAIEPNWFVHIAFNPSTSMTMRINKIDEIEISGEDKPHLLLASTFDEDEMFDMLLAMKIGNENMKVTIEGQD